jgi:hypothetical protein
MVRVAPNWSPQPTEAVVMSGTLRIGYARLYLRAGRHSLLRRLTIKNAVGVALANTVLNRFQYWKMQLHRSGSC